MNKKANVVIYIVFFMAAIVIIVIAAVLAPMGVLFTVSAFEAGEQILIQSNSSIQSIQDQDVKDAIDGSVTAAKDATELNIDVNSSMFQYAWVFVLIIAVIIAFISARSLIETRGFSGGFN